MQMLPGLQSTPRNPTTVLYPRYTALWKNKLEKDTKLKRTTQGHLRVPEDQRHGHHRPFQL